MAEAAPQGDAVDLKSPTTIVLNFLRSKGMPATGPNIRTVLEQNAREPGYIPELSNDAPSTDSGPSVGRSGNAAAKIEGSTNPKAQGDPKQTAGDQKTSAAPASTTDGAGPDLSKLGALIAAGTGLGAGTFGARSLMNRMSPGDAPVIPEGGANIADAPVATATDPMAAALDKATAPGIGRMGLTDVSTPELVRGVNPMDPSLLGNVRGPTTADPAMLENANVGAGYKPAPELPMTSDPAMRGMVIPQAPPNATVVPPRAVAPPVEGAVSRLLGGLRGVTRAVR